MSDLSAFAKEVQTRVRLSEVIGEHVDLKQRGGSMIGLCPFHNEKTPSFHVHDENGYYKCFGCGAGGDAITFLREQEGLDFIDSLKKLAGMANMPMPELKQSSPKDRERRKREESERESLLTIHDGAARFFQKEFQGSVEAQEYAQKRGLSSEAIQRFQIGYAPDDWQQLTDRVKKKYSKPELLVKSGLINQSQKEGSDGRLYDRFRHRLIFPIHDPQGRPIAFGGRSIRPEDEPKYINSPDTQLYDKSNTLYGFHLARAAIKKQRAALILEGYMDVVAVWQGGVENAVASCGTALTGQQAHKLRTIADTVFFLYDGDSAGQKAMQRGCLELFPQRFQVRVVRMPPEHDPDSYLREFGSEALHEKIADAEDAFDYFLASALKEHGAGSVGGRVKIGEEMMPLLAVIAEPIARANYAAHLGQVLGTPPEDLLREAMRKYKPRRSSFSRSSQPSASAPASRPSTPRVQTTRLKLAQHDTDTERPTASSETVPELDDAPDLDEVSPFRDDDDTLAGPTTDDTTAEGDDTPEPEIDEAEVARQREEAQLSPIELDSAELCLLRLALESREMRTTISEEDAVVLYEAEAFHELMKHVVASEDDARTLMDQMDEAGQQARLDLCRYVLVWRDEDFEKGDTSSILNHALRRLKKRYTDRVRREARAKLWGASQEEIGAHSDDLGRSAGEYLQAAGDYYGGSRRSRQRRQDKESSNNQ
jgi:DNA primase